MGIAFRDGYYQRFVRIGGRTIKDGEAAAIWNRRGVLRERVGPKRVHLFYSTIRFLDRHKAEAHEYLEVKHRDGTVENLRGPVHKYLNPGLHDHMFVKEAIRLKRNEVIRVCRTLTTGTDATAKNTKYMLRGPATVVPDNNERVDKFTWTKLPEELVGHSYPKETVSVLNPFKKRLWNVKVPMDTNAWSSWASILAITLKIDSFDKMTSYDDPYASLCAGLLADAKALGEGFAGKKFEEIQFEASRIISKNESYPNLFRVGEACGMCIESVKLLDFVPGEKIAERLAVENQQKRDLKRGVSKREDLIRLQELDLRERRKQIEFELSWRRKRLRCRQKSRRNSTCKSLYRLNREMS